MEGAPICGLAASLVYSKVYYRMELGFDFQNNKQRCWENRSSIGQLDLWDVLGHPVSQNHLLLPRGQETTQEGICG